jgi:hypothetical protein
MRYLRARSERRGEFTVAHDAQTGDVDKEESEHMYWSHNCQLHSLEAKPGNVALCTASGNSAVAWTFFTATSFELPAFDYKHLWRLLCSDEVFINFKVIVDSPTVVSGVSSPLQAPFPSAASGASFFVTSRDIRAHSARRKYTIEGDGPVCETRARAGCVAVWLCAQRPSPHSPVASPAPAFEHAERVRRLQRVGKQLGDGRIGDDGDTIATTG